MTTKRGGGGRVGQNMKKREVSNIGGHHKIGGHECCASYGLLAGTCKLTYRSQ